MRQALPLLILLLAACGATPPHETAVREGLNDRFLDPAMNVQDFEKNFEGESREVCRERDGIIELLGIKPGMAVADIGAGTGLFTFPMAQAVGSEGTVYAVEISPAFLKHLTTQTAQRNTPRYRWSSVPKTIRALSQTASTGYSSVTPTTTSPTRSPPQVPFCAPSDLGGNSLWWTSNALKG